jgi:hypothetical protein
MPLKTAGCLAQNDVFAPWGKNDIVVFAPGAKTVFHSRHPAVFAPSHHHANCVAMRVRDDDDKTDDDDVKNDDDDDNDDALEDD